MTIISSPRVIIGGTYPGVGKSLLMTGLAVALRKKGVSVSCCITGQALHQALIYSRVARRYTRTLDRRLLTPEQVLVGLYQASLGTDLILVDGQNGLYDGVAAGDLSGSDAEFAAITHTPVILVTDVARYSNSISALVKGYTRFASDVSVRGLVGAHLPVPEDSDPFSVNPTITFLNACMGAYKLPPFIGGVPTANFPTPIPPSVVSQDENRTSLPMQFFLDTASLVQNHVDIEQLVAIAESAPQLDVGFDVVPPKNRRCRFAVTDDSCFNVCFQDNLDIMRYFGADMVSFSPLADSELPRRVGGVYITGAYLKSYGEELSRNDSMKSAIRAFAEAGGVVYAEGAGTAYLCRSFQLERGGENFPGVGLIPADAIAVQQPRAFLEAETADESILGPEGIVIQGLSTGEWALKGFDVGRGSSLAYSLQVTIDGHTPVNEGYSASAQSCATLQLLHFGSNPIVAESLVEAAAVHESLAG